MQKLTIEKKNEIVDKVIELIRNEGIEDAQIRSLIARAYSKATTLFNTIISKKEESKQEE